MSFRFLAAWRRLFGLLGGVIFFLVLTSLVDGMISGGLKDPFLHELLPGQSVKLSKPMPNGAERLEDFEEMFTGFWMGGTLWRAEARLAQDIPNGEYTVTTFYQNGTAASPPQAFTLRVYPDAQAILAASGSFITRFLGLAPYLLAICLLPLVLVPMGVCFLLSRRISETLHAARMADVYRAMAAPKDAPEGTPAGQRIFFCPGQGHGLMPGDLVEVLDERGKDVVSTAEVFEIVRKDVQAIMHGGAKVRPGALVRLPQTH